MMILSYTITIAGICGIFVLIIYVYESLIERNQEMEMKEIKMKDKKEENEIGDIEDLEKQKYLEYKKLKEQKRKEWEEKKDPLANFKSPPYVDGFGELKLYSLQVNADNKSRAYALNDEVYKYLTNRVNFLIIS
jgi:hypothetical protein